MELRHENLFSTKVIEGKELHKTWSKTVKLFAAFRDGGEKVQVFQLEEDRTPTDIIAILGIEKLDFTC